MDLQIKDKVILVTGGAKGIGAAIVRACAAEGATPVIVDRDGQAAEQLQRELHEYGSTCELFASDRTDCGEVWTGRCAGKQCGAK